MGASLGCSHSQGVLAYCYWGGYGSMADDARSLQLMRCSKAAGSRYCLFMAGVLQYHGVDGEERSLTQALAFLQRAAAQVQHAGPLSTQLTLAAGP